MYFLCQESLKDKMEATMKMKKTELIDALLNFKEENEKLKEERFSKTDYERVVAEKEDYKSRYFKTKEELEEVSGELDEVKSEKWQQHLKDTDSEISYLNEEIDKLRKYKEFVIWAEEEDDFEAFSQM